MRIDLAFIIDDSGSIRKKNPRDKSYDNWTLMLEFVKKMIDFLDVSEQENHVAVVQFSTRAKKIFGLERFYSAEMAKKFDKKGFDKKHRS